MERKSIGQVSNSADHLFSTVDSHVERRGLEFLGLKVCLLGPFPPPIHGMSVQWDTLRKYLEREQASVLMANTQSHLAGRYVKNLLLRFVLFSVRAVVPVLRCQVLHIQARSDFGFWGPVCWPVLLGRLMGKRVVVTFQGGAGERFLRNRGQIALPFLKLADHIVVASHYLQQIFAQYSVTAHVLPNLLDVDRFEYRDPETVEPVLVMARHLHPHYNIPCALRAFKLIKARYPQARFFLTGTGPDEASLKALTAELGLSDVVYTGRVPDIRDVYRQAHIFVNTSRVDNSPVALVEAFASGLPVVSTRVGEVPNMIEDGVNGLLVEQDDHEGVAQAVISLVENPEKARAIRRASRERIRRYTWDSQRERLLALYTGQAS